MDNAPFCFACLCENIDESRFRLYNRIQKILSAERPGRNPREGRRMLIVREFMKHAV